jgi:DNA-binding NarL/FixJ family response regulator
MLFLEEAHRDGQPDAPESGGITVLIADPHHLVRSGLKLSVSEVRAGVDVLEAETLSAALLAYRSSQRVDLVLLDLGIDGAHGMQALDEFAAAFPGARIVALSSAHDMSTVQVALRRGARGFIPKHVGKYAFLNALRFVLDGGIYIPPEALMPQPDPLPCERADRRAPTPRSAGLTARQIDVLAQLLDGKPNKQICRELNLALGTVKCHVGAILGALDVNSRAEAIAAADKRGWREWLSQPRVQDRLAA